VEGHGCYWGVVPNVGIEGLSSPFHGFDEPIDPRHPSQALESSRFTAISLCFSELAGTPFALRAKAFHSQFMLWNLFKYQII
jgi:hypothetical protein